MQGRIASGRAHEGARKVLCDCLRLTGGDRVSIIHDETTAETAEVLIDEGESAGLAVTPYLVPLDHQRQFSAERGLCRQCLRALRGFTGILTCLSDEPGTTPYRRELVREGASGTTRLGHMPGARLFMLEWAVNIDYEAATARCEDLSLALATGTTARLETATFDDRGAETARYALSLDLGGPARFPVMSTGIVPAGAWGNLPGGETFIAPLEGTASGQIAITGAFKDRVLGPTEALVFSFERGRISQIAGPPDCRAAFERLVAAARAAHDPHWDELAELGIGVNQGITALTGNSLFDEKCAGTIHIAIGESQNFGGRLDSQIHEDLITRLPSLWIDERAILLDGVFVFSPEDWYDDLDDDAVDPLPPDPGLRVGRTPENTLGRNGELRRVHLVGAGRTCVYRIGNEAASPRLLRMYNQIRPFERVSVPQLCARLADEAPLTEPQVRTGLSILKRHGLVFVDGQ
jgi:hypothetical protein